MSVYDGIGKRLKNALKTILATITYDTGDGGEPAFSSVLDNTSGEFDSYPVLRILPADMTTGKGSVAENDRSVNFVARVHLPLENNSKTESQIYDWMYDLTDLIIDKLDAADFTHELENTDPSLQILFLNAARGDWMVAETNSSAVLMCDLNVEIKYSRDLA